MCLFSCAAVVFVAIIINITMFIHFNSLLFFHLYFFYSRKNRNNRKKCCWTMRTLAPGSEPSNCIYTMSYIDFAQKAWTWLLSTEYCWVECVWFFAFHHLSLVFDFFSLDFLFFAWKSSNDDEIRKCAAKIFFLGWLCKISHYTEFIFDIFSACFSSFFHNASQWMTKWRKKRESSAIQWMRLPALWKL